ncbi:MAG: glycosyltransferase family 2 protein [bacterium]|nr:glycosyltransferase family 2 protein [bacterium]
MTEASFVVLTQGDRPEELNQAIESIVAQSGIEAEIVLVSNGAGQIGTPDAVRLVVSRENLGIPGGRNLGAANSSHDVIFFLDDDAWYPSTNAATEALAAFAADDSLGIVSFRLADPETGRSEQRHVPRLRAGDPRRSSDVTTFLGGACAIKRAVFVECGGYAKRFFYSHEESDLAWRTLDAGFVIRYLGDVEVLHPAAPPSRHHEYHFRSARNRVWLARRRLPWLIAIPHVAAWTFRSLLRAGDRSARSQVWRGFRAGWVLDSGQRSPIRWSTVWRMTRLGRPPIV